MASRVVANEIEVICVVRVEEDTIEDYSGEGEAMQENEVWIGGTADCFSVDGRPVRGQEVLDVRFD